MRIAVFSLRFDDDGVGFDDSELQEFCASHRVLDASHQVVQRVDALWLIVIVSWREPPTETPPLSRQRGHRVAHLASATAPTEALDPAVAARYDALRTWRNQHARQSGKPPYLIFNNRQATQIAQNPPTTLAALASIEGIGPSRVEAWGAQVVELLAELSGVQPEFEPSDE